MILGYANCGSVVMARAGTKREVDAHVSNDQNADGSRLSSFPRLFAGKLNNLANGIREKGLRRATNVSRGRRRSGRDRYLILKQVDTGPMGSSEKNRRSC